MSLALPITPSRRGACPSLDTPMQTGDGLLARLRIAGGRLTPSRLVRVAEIAGNYGNGSIEITARGNLQVRGLTTAGAPHFARAVESIVAIERGLVVETPPLAGDDPTELADPRAIATAIRVASAPLAARLGPKVTVIVDGNGQLNLGGLKADIRLVAVSPERWFLTVGEADLGLTTRPADAAHIILTLLAERGVETRATDLSTILVASSLSDLFEPSTAPALLTDTPVGVFSLHSGHATGIGLPFGAMPWQAIADLGALGERVGIAEFRLAPHHSLLAIGAGPVLLDDARLLGFITSPDDPRRRISACIGNAGCASGHIAARSVADRLAPALAYGNYLHVSGCAKGCAHPRRASVTLVGRADGYGLVMEGTAGDTPLAILRADQLESVVGPARQG